MKMDLPVMEIEGSILKMDTKVIDALQVLRRKLDREFHDKARQGAKEITITLTVPIADASYMVMGLEDVLMRTRDAKPKP